MYDSMAPVCFEVLPFFNALLIIPHRLPLTLWMLFSSTLLSVFNAGLQGCVYGLVITGHIDEGAKRC